MMTKSTRTVTSNTSLPGIFSCFKASLQAHLAFDHTLAVLWSTFLIGFMCLGYFDLTLPLSKSLLRHTSPDIYFIHQGFLEKTYHFTVTLFFFFMNLRAFYGPTYVAPNINDLMWRTIIIGLGGPIFIGLMCPALFFSLPVEIQATFETVISLEASTQDTLIYGGLLAPLIGFCLYTMARFAFIFCVILETGKINMRRTLALTKGHAGKLSLFLIAVFTLSLVVVLPLGFTGALDITAQINPHYTGPALEFPLMGTWLWDTTIGKVLTFGLSAFVACLIQSVTFVAITFFYKAVSARPS